MSVKYPNYQQSLANLGCSILKKWGLKTINSSYTKVDELLAKNYKNVVVLLLDGMGENIIKNNLDSDGFFNRHLQEVYSSTFPPTTVAATTSICSGLTPNQHAWLGWDCYYPQIDENVTVFLNKKQCSDEDAADYNVAQRYCGYKSIVQQINENNGTAYEVSPFADPHPQSFDEICNLIKKYCDQPGSKYLYAYWGEPDHTLHENGCYADTTKDIVKELEAKVEKLSEQLEDTLLIVTADHGHIDSKGIFIDEYPDLMECLVRRPSIEPRALNFFVKKDCKERFEKLFNQYFGDDFMLLDKQSVLQQKLFGEHDDHPNFKDMLGDYLAIATSDKCLYNNPELVDKFIGVHAGITSEEMNIPLIVIEK